MLDMFVDSVKRQGYALLPVIFWLPLPILSGDCVGVV